MAYVRDYKEYYRKNKAAYAKRQKKYRLKNKEKEKKRYIKYNLDNKEKISKKNKKRYQENREEILARHKNSASYKAKLKGTGKKNLGVKTKKLWEDPQYRKHMSEAHKGKKGYWKGKKLPQELKDKMRDCKLKNPTRYWLNKKCPHFAGKNNPGYIHGKHPEHKRQRHCMEYERWRRQVFERDDFTCKICKQRGKKLNADHIKPFALYPKLRFVLKNGRTLCEECHRKTPTFGKKCKSSKRRGCIVPKKSKKP